MKKRNVIKIFTLIIMLVIAIVLGKMSVKTSYGADNEEKAILEGAFDKYVNYELESGTKATLVQYSFRTGVEYGEEFFAIKNSELNISLKQIDNKYPYDVKVICTSSKVTNGKTSSIDEDYNYDANTGLVTIRTNNENENGEPIYNTRPGENDRDEFIVIAYYDTYTDEKQERDLSCDATYKATLFTEDTREVTTQGTLSQKVTEDVGELTSISTSASDIYNGYIKSNVINGTSYDTEYTENNEIMISQKQAHQKISIAEENTFVNSNDIYYKSTKISKDDILNVLGENGKIDILDSNNNVIATVDNNTEFNENGEFVVTYGDDVNNITIKTSDIVNEGILHIENVKKIKASELNINDKDIVTKVSITGTEEEEVKTTEGETNVVEKEVYTSEKENVIEIKDATTSVDIKVDNTNWTNEKQNEVTFDITLNSSSVSNNLFSNPSFRINLPTEVEKVVLNNNSIMYANGLSMVDPFVETEPDGSLSIVVNLSGSETEYSENDLGLNTNIKLSATIVLNKNIESTTSKVTTSYTNNYTLDGTVEQGSKEDAVEISAYKGDSQENQEQTDSSEGNVSLSDSIEKVIEQAKKEEIANDQSSYSNEVTEEIDGLEIEVEATKGDTKLNDGDVVYEGEFIKYNVTVKNTTDSAMDNVKIIATIPEGTVYGELESDFSTLSSYKYQYNFDEDLTEKEIEVGTLTAGQTYSTYYEVQVEDLADGEETKEITTTMTAYAGNAKGDSAEFTNVIEEAEAKVFLWSKVDGNYGQWLYGINLDNPTGETVTIKLELPEFFSMSQEDVDAGKIYTRFYDAEYSTSISNVEDEADETYKYVYSFDGTEASITTTRSGLFIVGVEAGEELGEKVDNGRYELKAYATATVNDTSYKSNENRTIYSTNAASIVMTSDNEGEEVKYGEEIVYKIAIKCTSVTLPENENSGIYVNIADYLPDNVKPETVTYDYIEKNFEQKEGTAPEESGYKEKVTRTEDIGSTKEDGDGNALPNVDLYTWIPYGETINVEITTTAGYVYERTEIENSAILSISDTVVSDDEDGNTQTEEKTETQTSNIVKHIILPADSGSSETPGEPTDPEEPNNPNNPEDPNNPENPDNPNTRYNISGLAWNDKNGDGSRGTTESLISGIRVMLVDMSDQSNVKAETTTSTSGTYSFTNLTEGNYIVVFVYNTNIYKITEYKKTGVSDTQNSDATEQAITLNGESITAGVTDVIALSSNTSNIDVGLIQKDGYDLKLNKYITQVSVTTSSGTKQYSFDNSSLARVEIRSKEIEGAEVSVTYKIVVTNEGEQSATVSAIYDYLPDGLSFSTSGNSNWTLENGTLINRSLMNQTIASGESREVTLVLTKTMTGENTGTFTNAAEIGSTTAAISGIEDTDSTPGNRNTSEDDYEEASLIISVSTGLAVYISIGMIIFIIIVLALIFIKFKFKLKPGKISKIGMSIIMFMLIGLVTCKDSFALELVFDGNGWNANTVFSFHVYGGQVSTAECSEHGRPAAGQFFKYGWCRDSRTAYTESLWYDVGTYHHEEKSSPDANIQKLNDTISVRKIGNNYVLGPFMTSSNSSNNYSVVIKDRNGEIINGWSACTEDGTSLGAVPGGGNFYLSLSESLFARGVSYVSATQSVDQTISVYYSYRNYWKYTYVGGTCTYRNGFYGDPHQNAHSTTSTDGGLRVDHTETRISSDTVEWTMFNGTLDIIKVDNDDTNVRVNIEGTLRNDTTGETRTFSTTNGQYHFDNLTSGTYTLTETVNNNYGYESNVGKTVNIGVNAGSAVSVTIKNTKQTGSLIILKRDRDSNRALAGVSFKLRDSSGNYIIAVNSSGQNVTQVTGTVRLYNMRTTTNANSATTFTTDSNGEIKIYNIRTGTYTVSEISVGNNYYGYELDNNYITWNNGSTNGSGANATVTVSRQTSSNTENTSSSAYNTVTFQNRRKYIKLSGNVWEDMISGKTSKRDSLYTNGDNTENNPDKLVANVTVRLLDRNGNVVSFKNQSGNTVREILTDSNGHYVMTDVLIDQLQNYYIEFTYNGMSYTSVPIIDITLSNGTKAIENSETRTTFNNNYSTITHQGVTDPIGQSNNEAGRKTYDLNYDEGDRAQGDYTSTLNYGANSVYGYDGQRFPVNMTDAQYLITSTTRDAYLSLNSGYTGYLTDIKSADAIRKENITEITDINLGLREREQPDLALVEDIESAKVTLNGYEHTYYYNQRFSNQEVPEGFDVGVKFGTEYGSASYTQTIYSSDVVYNENSENPNGVLGVYVRYKVALRNESTNLYTRVNEVVNYFDNRYDIDSVTDEDGNSLNYTVDQNYNNNGFKKVTIQTNQNVVHQNQKSIYITYKLQNDAVNEVLNSRLTLDSVTEIASYSTYSDENFSVHYAGVDSDSRPGSAIPENRNNESDDTNKETYEDDTDKAPSFILQVSESEGRVIRGTVWEDNAIDELLQNTGYDKERKGDGIYVNGENVVEQVKVDLLTCDEAGSPTGIASLYKKDQVQAGSVVKEPESATTNTDSSGNYEFSGIIPGKYVIRYTYGNSSVIVKSDGRYLE